MLNAFDSFPLHHPAVSSNYFQRAPTEPTRKTPALLKKENNSLSGPSQCGLPSSGSPCTGVSSAERVICLPPFPTHSCRSALRARCKPDCNSLYFFFKRENKTLAHLQPSFPCSEPRRALASPQGRNQRPCSAPISIPQKATPRQCWEHLEHADVLVSSRAETV